MMKRHGRPRVIVTDRLRSYGAAMKEIGNAGVHETGRWLNNRAENSHQPFRRRERAMLRFRRMHTLQKFSAVHASVHNHFNQERHLVSRDIYKARRSAALAEWQAVMGYYQVSWVLTQGGFPKMATIWFNIGSCRRFAMASAVWLRDDFDAAGLRSIARRSG